MSKLNSSSRRRAQRAQDTTEISNSFHRRRPCPFGCPRFAIFSSYGLRPFPLAFSPVAQSKPSMANWKKMVINFETSVHNWTPNVCLIYYTEQLSSRMRRPMACSGSVLLFIPLFLRIIHYPLWSTRTKSKVLNLIWNIQECLFKLKRFIVSVNTTHICRRRKTSTTITLNKVK